MSEKLHNNDYDATNVSGTAANSNDLKAGNSNKIKLKATTYAIVMEVQEAFMQEELEKQNEELNKLEAGATNTALTEEEQKEVNSNIASLKADIDSMKKVYDEFSNARVRFTEMSKKALKVHEENIEQMKENDKELAEEPKMSVDFSDYEKAQTVLEDAQDANIFSNVDSEAIKEEVNRVMTGTNILTDEDLKEYENNGDWLAKNMVSDIFDDAVTAGANEAQENLKEQEPEKMSKANIEADLDRYLGGATDNKDEEIKPYRPHVGPLQPEEETKPPVENNGPIFGPELPTETEPEYDIPNPIPNQNDSKTERRYTTSGKVHNSRGVNFDGDTSFKQFLTSRQEGLNEKSKAVSSLRTEVDTLEQTAKDKKERLAEATRKSEQDAADMEIMAKQLEELKRLDEEENKLSSEETTLNDRKSELNSEISGYDERIDEIEKQNAANLEKYKAMQEEINKYIKGKTPDDGQYGGAGGRRK